jgi:hypothetical protein
MRFDLQYTPEAVEQYRGSRAVRSILSPALQRKNVDRMANTRHNFVVVLRPHSATVDLPLFSDAVTLGLTVREVEGIDKDTTKGAKNNVESLYTAFTYLHRFGDHVTDSIAGGVSLYLPHERAGHLRRPSDPVYAEFYAMTDAHLEALAEAGWAPSIKAAYDIYTRLIGESVNSKMVREGYSLDWMQAFADLFPLCELTPPSRPLFLPFDEASMAMAHPRPYRDWGKAYPAEVAEACSAYGEEMNVRFRALYNTLIPALYGTVWFI